ncbi:hypothetical protein ONZ45_g316 [Pleurotus djamor]|nr:hypothetical protein ONZ45_g316 [Pleurotus djamor]
MSSPSAKDIVALATALAYHWTMTPPNPPVAKEEYEMKGVHEGTVRFRAALDKTLVWAAAMMEVSSSLYRTPSSQISSAMPPVFIIGATICILGSLLRAWCFKALGEMFDFEYRIKDNHKLITAGPYNYVRHPSYTGLFSMYIGATMVGFAPGSWLREYGLLYKASTVAGAYWCLEVTVVIVVLSMRMLKEDAGLKRKFGEEWNKFAARVPYLLIPGVV